MLTQCQVKRGESEEGPYFTITLFNISFYKNRKITRAFLSTKGNKKLEGSKIAKVNYKI